MINQRRPDTSKRHPVEAKRFSDSELEIPTKRPFWREFYRSQSIDLTVEDTNKVIDEEEDPITVNPPIVVSVKLPADARRYISNQGWSRLRSNWKRILRDDLFQFLRVEQVRIAEYEVEQTKRDIKKKKLQYTADIETVLVLEKIIDAELRDEDALIKHLERRVHVYRSRLGSEGYTPNLTVPAEMVVDRIKRRINNLISLNGGLVIDSASVKRRIKATQATIDMIDKQSETLDILSVELAEKKKLIAIAKADQLQGELVSTKAQVNECVKHLQKAQEDLINESVILKSNKEAITKYDNIIKESTAEIEQINHEINEIESENVFMRNNLSDIKCLPTIMDYVKLDKRWKEIQHETAIYTQRVRNAEVS
ncbi:unnamed protein product [Didymodactylos carnosus]|uniref:Uncharacterized protein n=1 Tax=Didymodactylos carnosus TaxID=1234261 RepID=A0A815M4T5_9BILA|nr:unnamed protein product [Didymodactylos carnosus]CAF1418566.1 unnamed protein product [Didymodactylos carnosus]CAF3745192.1 unnamed protein product [Didymodactylos carnosus]CAF4303048.1 unnamed protein product [Didymodactylos carnosus]